MVQKVRGLYNKAIEWKEATGKILKGGEKLSRLDAKTLLEEGEKLGFVCDELKLLRNAHKTAKSWATRAKRCKVEQGSTNANSVQDLIDEHDSLIIEMPDELLRLEQAMKSYCLCRRPYSGFMIGCDECEEWYHGYCIGISESKADRVDKFVCVRCSVTRAFKGGARDAVGVIRKWTCLKDMKKARQVEAQKHQRKVRKETKEIEKLRGEIEALESQQQQQQQPTEPACLSATENPTPMMEPIDANSIAVPTPGSQQADCSKAEPENSETQKHEEPKRPSIPKLPPEQGKKNSKSDAVTIRPSGISPMYFYIVLRLQPS